MKIFHDEDATLEPLRGTRAHVGDLIDRCQTAAELVAALTGQG